MHAQERAYTYTNTKSYTNALTKCAHAHPNTYAYTHVTTCTTHAYQQTCMQAHARLHAHDFTPMKTRVYGLAHLSTKAHIHTLARTHERTHPPTHTHTYMIKYKRGLVCMCILLHVHRQTDGRTDGQPAV